MTWVQTNDNELLCLETGMRLCYETCVGVPTLFLRPVGYLGCPGTRLVARNDRARTLFNRAVKNLVCEYLDNYDEYSGDGVVVE